MPKEIVFVKPVNPETISWLIDQCKDEKEISLLLSSGGGDPISGIAFYNFIKQKRVKLTVTIIGVCESAATILLCAGQIRRANSNTTFLFHSNRRCFKGDDKYYTADELNMEAMEIRNLFKTLCQIVSKTCKQPFKKVRKLHLEDKNMSASEVFKLGLLTEKPR